MKPYKIWTIRCLINIIFQKNIYYINKYTYYILSQESNLYTYIYIYHIILAGFSEDSDYTSDLNFPINGKLPNAAASSSSQYLATAFQSKNSGENRRASEDAADSTQSLQVII